MIDTILIHEIHEDYRPGYDILVCPVCGSEEVFQFGKDQACCKDCWFKGDADEFER